MITPLKNTLRQIPGKGFVLFMGQQSLLDYSGNTGYFPYVATLPAVSRDEAYRNGAALLSVLRLEWEKAREELEAEEAAAEAAAEPYNWAIVP